MPNIVLNGEPWLQWPHERVRSMQDTKFVDIDGEDAARGSLKLL